MRWWAVDCSNACIGMVVSNVLSPLTLVATPVPAWREIGITERASASDPHISVVIPFHDPRGHPDNLRGWTRDQSLEGALFEVIVSTEGNLDSEVEAKL